MPSRQIHPTALIGAQVKLGAAVTIGPYAIIEDQVDIGDGCFIEAHAVIRSYVRMGKRNRIHPHAIIGGLPQDLSFQPSTLSGVRIGDDNVLREGVTVNRATQEHGETRIGNACYLMNNSHVAHDCEVGDGSIFATGATIGGHVKVGAKVFLGGGAMVHQYCRIGSLAMIRGVTGISMDVIPYTLAGGTPVRHYRLNSVGLRRSGIDGTRYQALSAAFRRLRKREKFDDLETTPEILYLRTWLQQPSKRGIHAFL